MLPDPMIEAWSAYWRTGRRVSLTEGGAETDIFARYWESFFGRLAGGARVLDLATGQGYVAKAAQALAKARSIRFDIVGVDAAAIEATAAPTLTQVGGPRLIGGVRLEALPFPDGSFDAITSQFGLEYADELAALRELARVLRGDGKVRLLLHARDGAIYSAVRQRVVRLRLLMGKRGLVPVILSGARALVSGDALGVALASLAVDQARSTAGALRSGAPDEDAALFYAEGLVRIWLDRRRYAPADILKSVADANERIQALLLRQEALLLAAHSAESIQLSCALLSRLGVHCQAATSICDKSGEQVAWLLDGRKA